LLQELLGGSNVTSLTQEKVYGPLFFVRSAIKIGHVPLIMIYVSSARQNVSTGGAYRCQHFSNSGHDAGPDK
jgi:hypothetical protein